jgi:2-amino-4-hydroxy-6-hydroxymethyldihydropteridine diphosphokinase
MDHVRRVVVGIGSNLGDRRANLAAASAALGAVPGMSVMARSPVYESPPAGGPPQGDYLNAAVLLATALPGEDVLRHALEIERRLGRERAAGARWEPRTVDLDVLWIEGETIAEPGLTVPHPRLGERPFAVRPLLDVAPDATDPGSGTPYASLPAASTPLRLFEG